jgi:uncharacterized membrane protein YjjP (DUF1212 family)
MKIDATVLLPVAAVVSSVLLLMAGKLRVFEVIALIASGVWLALQLDLFNWPIKNANASPPMVLGAALVVAGIAVYLNTSNKREVTASTVVTILGGMLLVNALARLG